MGCSICAHVEVLIDDDWHFYSAPIILRDPALFACLRGEKQTRPIPLGSKFLDKIQPNTALGIPGDVSAVTNLLWLTHCQRFGGVFSPGWLDGASLHFLMQYVYATVSSLYDLAELGDFFGIDWSDWSPSTSIVAGSQRQVRLVYWFDS